jgi:hypothetical protein
MLTDSALVYSLRRWPRLRQLMLYRPRTVSPFRLLSDVALSMLTADPAIAPALSELSFDDQNVSLNALHRLRHARSDSSTGRLLRITLVSSARQTTGVLTSGYFLVEQKALQPVQCHEPKPKPLPQSTKKFKNKKAAAQTPKPPSPSKKPKPPTPLPELPIAIAEFWLS